MTECLIATWISDLLSDQFVIFQLLNIYIYIYIYTYISHKFFTFLSAGKVEVRVSCKSHTTVPYITVERVDVHHQMACTSVTGCLGSKCVHELLWPISELCAECGCGGGGPRHSLEVWMETTRRCDGSQDTRALRVQLSASLVYFTLMLSGVPSVEVLSSHMWHNKIKLSL
jgi:hypothetical protein